MAENKIEEIKKLSKITPVIVVGATKEDFEGYVSISATIPSKNLGVVPTEKGLKVPKWFFELKTNPNLLIYDIDSIDEYNQQKFYELLKYREITNTPLPKDCSIVVLAQNLEKINQNILSFCMISK